LVNGLLGARATKTEGRYGRTKRGKRVKATLWVRTHWPSPEIDPPIVEHPHAISGFMIANPIIPEYPFTPYLSQFFPIGDTILAKDEI